MSKLVKGYPPASGYWWLANPATGRCLLVYYEVGPNGGRLFNFFGGKVGDMTHHFPEPVTAPEFPLDELEPVAVAKALPDGLEEVVAEGLDVTEKHS